MRAETDNSKPPNGKRNWGQRLRRWGLEGALIVVVLAAVHWYKARPLAEGMAPALSGPSVTTLEQIDLSSPATGPRLVHFWASWCPICKLEEGSLEAIGTDYEVITVAMQSGDADAIGRYLDERALDLPVIADPDGDIASRWGVQAVPAGFVIDRNGQIRFRRTGYTTGLGLRARLWLAQLSSSWGF